MLPVQLYLNTFAPCLINTFLKTDLWHSFSFWQ